MSQKTQNNKGFSFRRGIAAATLSILFAGTLPTTAQADPESPFLLDLDHNPEDSALTGTVASPGANITLVYPDGTVFAAVDADENGFFEFFIPEDIDLSQLSIWVMESDGDYSFYRDNVTPSNDYVAPSFLQEEIILHGNSLEESPVSINASEESYLIVRENGDIVYDSEEAGEEATEEHSVTLEVIGGELDESSFYTFQLKDRDGNHSEEINAIVLGEIEFVFELLERDEEDNQVIPYQGSSSTVDASAPSGTEITYQASWMDEPLTYTVEGNPEAPMTEYFSLPIPGAPAWEEGLTVSVTANMPNGETFSRTFPVVESNWEIVPPLPDVVNIPENAIQMTGIASSDTELRVVINGTEVEGFVLPVPENGRYTISLEDFDIQEGDVITLIARDISSGDLSFESMEINVIADSGVTSGPDTPIFMYATEEGVYVDSVPDSAIYRLYDSNRDLISTSLLSTAENGIVILPGMFEDGETIYLSALNVEGYESELLEIELETVGPPELVIDSASFRDDEPIVTGTTEPGAYIVITEGDGEDLRLIASGYADDEGSFSITLPIDDPVVSELTPFNVRSTGQYGTSAPVVIQFSSPEKTYEAPVVPESFEDGVLTGTITPGLTVVITDAEGNEVTTTVADEDGNFSVTLEGYAETTMFSVFGVDEWENETPIVQTMVADVTAPTGTVGNVAAGQRYVDIEAEEDPSGINITVYGPDGETVVDSIEGLMTDGLSWSAELPGYPEGTVFYVEFSDGAGNSSRTEITVSAQEEYSMRVQVPSVMAGEQTISGLVLGGVGVTAYATINGGATLEVDVDEDSQSFVFQLESPVSPDDSIQIWAEDEGGSRTETVTVDVVHDQLDAPRVDFVSGSDTTITGRSQNAVNVRLYAAGSSTPLDEVEVDENFRFSFNVGSLSGGQVFIIAGVDAFGIEGASTRVVVDEDTTPELTVNPLREGVELVTGSTSPGAVVTVHDGSNTELGRATANPNGEFSVELNRPLEGGDRISVVAILNGVPSDTFVDEVGDSTPPEAPEVQAVNNMSESIMGQAEAGSTVVASVNGSEVGSTTADANGTFVIDLSESLPAGTTVRVTATDRAGNTSEPTEIIVGDVIAPPLEINHVEYGDDVISGTTDAGVRITVFDSNRDELASGVANDSGNFSVRVDDLELDATYIVQAFRQAGSPIAEETVQVLDTIGPEIDPDSIRSQQQSADLPHTIIGTTEPGVTAYIFYPGERGTPIASSIVDEEGYFSFEVGDIAAGTLLHIQARDASDNWSEGITTFSMPASLEEDIPVVVVPDEDSTDEDSTDSEDGDGSPDGTEEDDTTLPGYSDDDIVYEIDEDGNLVPVTSSAEDLEQTGSNAARAAGVALMMFTAGGVVFALRRRMDESETA